MSQRTSGRFTCADWQESEVGSGTPGPKLARAAVANSFSGGIEAERTHCEYAIVYVTEKTGTYTGMELLDGRLDGRAGAFAVEQRGTFEEDGTVHCAFEVVPGSGTGELAGLRGKGTFTAGKGEPAVPYTFEYELD